MSMPQTSTYVLSGQEINNYSR